MRRACAGLVVLVGAVGAARAGGLDKPAFTANGDELLAEAKKVHAGDADVVVLREDDQVTFDDAGRETDRHRTVFVIERASGVDDWGSISLGWSPFYQDKPTVRARVIGTGGKIAELDPSLMTDAPAVNESPSVYSDRRQLEVPLPRLAVGSVVEEEFVTKDREPLLAAGATTFRMIGRAVPVEHTTITISAPASRHLQVIVRGVPKLAPQRATAKGRTSWTFDIGRLAAITHYDDNVPADGVVRPYVGITTGDSWAHVATGYDKLVAERLAQPGFTAPAELKGTSDRETVDRAVSWLHQHVRYTGIELSDAAIVPWPPAETMKRGFGDCKDKATLLVALLRALGVHADVALLSTGPGPDVVRELPGMGEFDHAIVRARVAGADVWIDATEDALPAGQLPARDQGRRALIVAPDTRDLVVTPPPASRDNVIRKVRTYRLAEIDSATITEVQSETGAYRDYQRRRFRDSAPEDVKKFFDGYAKDMFDGKVARLTPGDVADVAKPFTVTLEVSDALLALSGRKQAEVYLNPTDTLLRVPDVLDGSNDRDDAVFLARTADYVWFVPHVYDIETRIVIPPGYEAPAVAPRDELHLGTMTLTTTRALDKDTLVVTYHLDTGKPQITAAELRATREAVKQLRQQRREHLVFTQTAVRLLREGKIQEAIAECQRLIALHPKEALHLDQLADAYRTAGMGEAARRAAKKAVDLQPTADAYDMLAWQLRHDTLGREWGFDADRAGALAAYRKAIALEPRHEGALADLATLLANDGAGGASERRDQLEAVAMWRRAREISKGTGYDRLIVGALFAAGELPECEKAARALPESEWRASVLVAVLAVSRGVPAALAELSAMPASLDRKRVLATGASLLWQTRRYDVLRALYAEEKDAVPDSMPRGVIDRMARVDVAKLDARDPKTPVVQSFVSVLFGTPGAWDADIGRELEEESRSVRRSLTPAMRQLPRAMWIDLMASMLPLQVDGSAKDGWRVHFEAGSSKGALYVISDHGKAKLLGAAEYPGGVGKLVLALLAKRDIAGARRWLDWVAEDLKANKPLPWTPMSKLLAGDPSRDHLELAAAMLLVRRDSATAAPVLRRCAPGGDDVKKLCRDALRTALVTLEQWKELEELERAAEEQDTSIEPRGGRAMALALAGRTGEATAELDKALAKEPDSLAVLQLYAQVQMHAGKWNDAATWFAKLTSAPASGAMELNNAAWAHLYYDRDPARARGYGERAEQANKKLRATLANTLAAIEAESDRPYRAWQYTLESLAGQPDGKPSDADWYVIGRIAETYGLRDDAIAAYRRVHRPAAAQLMPSAYDFAQRHLQKLGVAAAKK